MAKARVYPVYVDLKEGATMVKGTTVTSVTDGCDIVYNGADKYGKRISVKDESTFALLENTGTEPLEVAVKSGTGYASGKDDVITIPASSTVIKRFDGARWKNKGVVTLLPKTASALKVTVYSLI